MVITLMDQLAGNATLIVQHVMVVYLPNAQGAKVGIFWMSLPIVLEPQYKILELHVDNIAIRIVQVGTMFWQVTTVLTWDRTDHLNLVTIGLIQMNPNACSVISSARSVPDTTTEIAKPA